MKKEKQKRRNKAWIASIDSGLVASRKGRRKAMEMKKNERQENYSLSRACRPVKIGEISRQ
jgi:hypothetical protein